MSEAFLYRLPDIPLGVERSDDLVDTDGVRVLGEGAPKKWWISRPNCFSRPRITPDDLLEARERADFFPDDLLGARERATLGAAGRNSSGSKWFRLIGVGT